MNNKIILGIVIVLIAVVGGILLVFNKKRSTAPQTTVQTAPVEMPSAATQAEKNRIKTQMQRVTVRVTSSGFEPAVITIKAGTSVIWGNESGAAATVNSDKHPTHQVYRPLNLGEFPNGSSVQLMFDKNGTYGYHNHLNPSRTGTVKVE